MGVLLGGMIVKVAVDSTMVELAATIVELAVTIDVLFRVAVFSISGMIGVAAGCGMIARIISTMSTNATIPPKPRAM